VGPRELEPNRPDTNRADPSGSPAGDRASQLSEPWSGAEAEGDLVASSATGTLFAPLLADRFAVSVADAGQMLGVSRAFAYELVARGELPTIRLGRRVMVPKVALLAMVGLSPLQS
jgi:excisionase family DNA binding protein